MLSSIDYSFYHSTETIYSGETLSYLLSSAGLIYKEWNWAGGALELNYT